MFLSGVLKVLSIPYLIASFTITRSLVYAVNSMWITGTITRKAKSEAKSLSPLRGLQVDFSLPSTRGSKDWNWPANRTGVSKLCLTFWLANDCSYIAFHKYIEREREFTASTRLFFLSNTISYMVTINIERYSYVEFNAEYSLHHHLQVHGFPLSITPDDTFRRRTIVVLLFSKSLATLGTIRYKASKQMPHNSGSIDKRCFFSGRLFVSCPSFS